MARRPSSLLYRVRRLLLSDHAPEGDRALLDRYAHHNDGDAFRELLDRHGALVLGACRRVLGDNDLVEDVFQATFLVLARKPGAVRGRDAIGPWLYAIARRLAQRAFSERGAEQRREQKAAAARSTSVTVDFAARELLTVLDDELEKLPDRLRLPLFLCYLQGRTLEESARELGWSLSTIRRRLEKGIAILRQRLTQRGATFEAVLFAAAISPEVVSAVPKSLMLATFTAVGTNAADNGHKSTACHLAREGLKMLTNDRLKLLASVALGVGVLAGTVFGLQRAMRPADPLEPPETARTVQVQAPTPTDVEVIQRLTDFWQKQREMTKRGKYEIFMVRTGFPEGQEITRDDFYTLLGSMSLNDVRGFLQKILDLDPLPPNCSRAPLDATEVRDDGSQSLVRSPSSDLKHPERPYIAFDDGRVQVEYRSVCDDYGQASVYDPIMKTVHMDDLRYIPDWNGKTLDKWYAVDKWEVAERKNGRVRLHFHGERGVFEIEADEKTGFIFAKRELGENVRLVDEKTGEVSILRKPENSGSTAFEFLQFGPTVDRAGRSMPTLRIDATYTNDKLSYISAYYIAKFDLDAKFDESDFKVSTPAGTIVVDSRGDSHNPKRRFARGSISDVLAYANAIPDETRPFWPRLKYGTAAPVLSATVWLTQNGKVEAPNLKGKIVLVDFWGTTCGPCLAEFPNVQAAAKKHTDSDLVFIGLHDSSGKVEQLTEFARKNGLTYLLGIDRPAEQGPIFGATFQAFGIRSIPSAAVIDREGRLVFVGRFGEGLQKAEELLSQKK